MSQGRKAVSLAADAAGTVAGLAASSILGPGGSLAAPFVQHGLEDFLQRMLSARQQQRVITVAKVAAQQFREGIAGGGTLRGDGFFDARDGRWSANEVVEAVLLTASREPMELKIPHLGHLLAALALSEDLDVSASHWLIRLAEELSWTQYVQLAIVAKSESLDLPDIQIGAHCPDWHTLAATRQLANLGYAERELIGVTQPKDGKLPVNLGHLRSQQLRSEGRLLHHYLDLEKIPVDALEEQVSLLRRCVPPD